MPQSIGEGGVFAALLAGATALGAFGRELIGWLKGWRAEKRDAASAAIAGAASAVDVMHSVMEVVNARLKESEAECERRVEAAIQTIRSEWENERKGLRAAIGALSALLPPDARKRLDEKLRAIVDEIAPEAVA